jgi:hypothetical protein
MAFPGSQHEMFIVLPGNGQLAQQLLLGIVEGAVRNRPFPEFL